MMEEIWKDIRGFEGRYKISSYGNVWQSGKYIDGRQYKSGIKKARLNQFGYPYVTLYYGDKRKTITIHRLVAEHFIPNPNNYKCVDHIDTNKQNNHVKNLRWCTYSMNANNPITRKNLSTSLKEYCKSKEVRKERSKNAKKNIEKMMVKVRVAVSQYTKDGVYIQDFPSASEAARYYNGNCTSITRCCRRKRPSAYGFIWRYKNEKL